MLSRLLAVVSAVLIFAAAAEARPRNHPKPASEVTQFCGDRYCPVDAPASASNPATRKVSGGPGYRGSADLSESITGAFSGVLRYLPHPAGCPRRAFCACGAAVHLFGKPIRGLWPVRAWRQFRQATPAPGRVAIERRRSHLFVLKQHVGGSNWLVYDWNSGGHRSRVHVRSIASAIIVDPTSRSYASR